MSSPSTSPTTPPITIYSQDKRVRLATPSSVEDADVSVVRSDPLARRYLRFMPPITVEGVKERRESRAQDPHILDFNVFLLQQDYSPSTDTETSSSSSSSQTPQGELIGMTGVFNIDDLQKSCEMGILLSPKVHGTGISTVVLYTIMKYIFEERKFHRVTLETGEDNMPMRGWLEKYGVRCEATRLEAWTDGNGGWTDVKGYAVLDREWVEVVKPNLEKKLGLLQV